MWYQIYQQKHIQLVSYVIDAIYSKEARNQVNCKEDNDLS